MQTQEALSFLKAHSKANTARLYSRHGISDEIWGVGYADMAKLEKRIKHDQDLALALWDSGIHEARQVACKVADPAACTKAQLTAWMKQVTDYLTSGAVGKLVAHTAHADALAKKWIDQKGEWPSATGWNVLVCQAQQQTLDAAYASQLIERVRTTILSAPNRTKYSMLNFLIAAAGYYPELVDQVHAVDQEIGRVKIDHGDTYCKTPEVRPYIAKILARRAKAAT